MPARPAVQYVVTFSAQYFLYPVITDQHIIARAGMDINLIKIIKSYLPNFVSTTTIKCKINITSFIVKIKSHYRSR
ncbi:hypothetical protein A6768_04385 [Sphingobium yanoikuyae]|uniref:Uncharacterized protein n=1 Tax=Sphingobium yanoikuyae TaxID=13690 RepID=A0A291MW65_SPHYA|nr:hypothetical protein A6768_04385 [Sphingobium yanoikuyae]